MSAGFKQGEMTGDTTLTSTRKPARVATASPPPARWSRHRSANEWAGKTVVACALIAHHHTPTLVQVEEATVDCYGEEEQLTGLYTMIGEHLTVPFETQVLGVDVTVEDVELSDDGRVVAICAREAIRQAISLVDLPLPTPRPDGAEWIDAYRRWAPR